MYKGETVVSHQDDVFVKTSIGVLGGLAVFTVVIIILANSVGVLENQGVRETSKGPHAVIDRIQPVGKVRLAGETPKEAPAPKAARSGKEVVTAACAACHATGAAGAPKIGDKAAWEPRAAAGMATLLDHARNGFKGMPARGGNPSVMDEELEKAVAYMLGETGVSAGGGAAPVAASAPAADAAAPQASTGKGKETYQTACFACHGTGAAGAPKLGDKGAWGPRIAQGLDVLKEHALGGIRGMPPKGGRMDLPDADIIAAMEYMVSQGQ